MFLFLAKQNNNSNLQLEFQCNNSFRETKTIIKILIRINEIKKKLKRIDTV